MPACWPPPSRTAYPLCVLCAPIRFLTTTPTTLETWSAWSVLDVMGGATRQCSLSVLKPDGYLMATTHRLPQKWPPSIRYTLG